MQKSPQFNEEELQLILSAIAFTTIADINFDYTPETNKKLLDIAERIRPYQDKIIKEMYVLNSDEYESDNAKNFIDNYNLTVKTWR